MEFLGDDEGRSWPRLKDVKLSEDEAAAMEKEVSRQVGLLRAAGLVHADLSEYNILVGEGKPYIIDMAQAVSVKHPKAEIFAERDRDNMRKYFSRLVK
jgi:RIO kinase 1